MKKTLMLLCLMFYSILSNAQDNLSDFRVLPYLLSPHQNSIIINWFTETATPGQLIIFGKGNDSLVFTSKPRLVQALSYSKVEEDEREQFPDMFINKNYKHTIVVEELQPGKLYHYQVKQKDSKYRAQFKSAPAADNQQYRLIVLADSETDPAGRNIYRSWQPGRQHDSSTGRPDTLKHYPVTETKGYQENIRIIKQQKPDLILMPGDLVQGGGYQRAWDEFFFHNAGKFDNPFSYSPVLPAIGNWENFGARNGGYHPEAIYQSRLKYKEYFDAPSNNNSSYSNYYYRIDYGKITILTLDSSNGLPDSTDADTNININKATYPGDNLPDYNPGSDQWQWTLEQLQDASAKGQLIFIQFHHIPYSSGGHSLPMSVEGSSGQAGIPMRIYTPYFKKYGVVAVFCGHNESFEHSIVDNIHFFDTGVAGDGFGYSLQDKDPRFYNAWQQWVAHFDAPELWQDTQLISGGKHYGHLQVDIEKLNGSTFQITFAPVHVFPVMNSQGKILSFERREYANKTTVVVQK